MACHPSAPGPMHDCSQFREQGICVVFIRAKSFLTTESIPWMCRGDDVPLNGGAKISGTAFAKLDHTRLARRRTASFGGTGLRPVRAARMATPPEATLLV